MSRCSPTLIDPALQNRWRLLGHADTNCLVVLRNAVPPNFESNWIACSEDPALRSLDRKQLRLFSHSGIGATSYTRLSFSGTSPTAKPGLRQLAHICADYQDYRQAFEPAAFRAPVIGKTSSSIWPPETRFKLTRRMSTRESRCILLSSAKENPTMPLQLSKFLPRCGQPKYVFYLEAQTWAQEANGLAWKALRQFEPPNRFSAVLAGLFSIRLLAGPSSRAS
jgi:hypothetical protein